MEKLCLTDKIFAPSIITLKLGHKEFAFVILAIIGLNKEGKELAQVCVYYGDYLFIDHIYYNISIRGKTGRITKDKICEAEKKIIKITQNLLREKLKDTKNIILLIHNGEQSRDATISTNDAEKHVTEYPLTCNKCGTVMAYTTLSYWHCPNCDAKVFPSDIFTQVNKHLALMNNCKN